MTKYANLMNPALVPQSEPLNERQVANNAGGFVFTLDKWKRLDRFLILGSDANTYYQKARDLTRANAKVVEECWAEDPLATQTIIEQISLAGRAPKNDPAIFALALGTVSANMLARQLAYGSVWTVCRTGTHLFQFVATAKALGKGFGRGMKRAVANWYNSKPVDALAYQVVKYRSRENLTHENLLDMAHPKTDDPLRNLLYKWLVGKLSIDGDVARPADFPPMVIAHELAMKAVDAKGLLPIMRDNPSLPWEAMPTWARADVNVQKALLPHMPLTATIRNLGNLTRIGAITPMSDEETIVRGKLTVADEIRKARVHPMAVLTALKVYAAGRGLEHGHKVANTWSPNQKIVNALDDAFYMAFQNVEPTGKRHFIGIDVSGSMASPISGSAALSCCEAAAALALVTVRTEPLTFVGRFNRGIEPVTFSDRSRMDDVLIQTRSINGGGTDCALPMLYALQHGIKADVFVVLTDNETWAGNVHPVVALQQYRKATGIPAKLIVVGMTATGFTIADPNDAGMLDVVGFDAAMPAVMAEFVRG